MADMANPRKIIDYYGARNGVSVPGSAGLRPIGPTPARAFPLAPYQPPAPAPQAPSFRGKVIPSGPTIEMGGRSPVPALRPSGAVTGVAERGFTMGGSSPTYIDASARPAPSAAPKQIGYRPIRVPGAGIEGMGDYAPNQGAEMSRLPKGKLPGFRGILSKGAGVLKQGVKSLFSPVGVVTGALSAVANAQSDATAYDNLLMGTGTSNTVLGASGATYPRRFGASGSGLTPDQSVSTNAISYRTRTPVVARDQIAPDFAVASAAPAPVAGRTAARPSRNTEAAFRTSQEGAYAPRASFHGAATSYANPENDPPAGFGEAPRAMRPKVIELTDAAGAMPTAVANQLPLDENGGYAFTGDRGDNVERMFYLRPRTAEEDAAAPAVYNQGVYPEAETGMSPGSQGAWELDQERDAMVNRPFPFKTEAAMQARRTLQETTANNLRNFQVNQQNADTSAAGTLSQNLERETLLPGKVLEQDSSLLTDEMGRQKTAEEIKGMPAERDLKTIMGGYYRTLGSSMEKKSNDDLALQKLLMQDQWKKDELEARNNSPLTKADAEYAAGLGAQVALPPSEAATAVKAGYRKVQKGKNRWFREDIPQGLVNDAGQVYTPGAEAAPVRTGTRPNGEVWGEFADGSVRRIN